MTQGRPAKPTFLRHLDGKSDSSKSTFGDTHSTLPAEPPIFLEGQALAEWERLSSQCFWLRDSDAHALADRCVCWQRLLEAEEDVQRRGLLVGRRKTANPSTRLARQYRAAVANHDLKLGISAATRAGVGAQGKAQDGEFDVLEVALAWPFGFAGVKIWAELRRGKTKNPSTPAEHAELAVDRLESDRRMHTWKESHGIPVDIDEVVAAPGHGASQEEWLKYHLGTLDRNDRIVKACTAVGLDAYRC